MTIRTLAALCALISTLALTAPAAAGVLDCPGDLDGNNSVDIDDIVLVVLNFGCSVPPSPACPGDANMDGIVNIDDIVVVVLNFGPCPAASNDECVNAIDILEGDTIFDTDRTTTDGLAHAGCEGDGQVHHDTWYRYTATNTGVLIAYTCGDLGVIGQASYDTDLALYDDNGPAPCPPTDLELLDCGDDVCSGAAAYVETPVTAGDVVLIRLGGGEVGDMGSGILTVVCAPASDDHCSTAPPIADGQTITLDTNGADVDYAGPACGFGSIQPEFPGRWLRCIGDGSNFTVQLCNNPGFPDDNFFFDTRLNVYCGPCTDLTCAVNEPDDNFPACGPNETATWCTAPGAEYYILVHADTSDTGTVDVTLTSSGPACGAAPCP